MVDVRDDDAEENDGRGTRGWAAGAAGRGFRRLWLIVRVNSVEAFTLASREGSTADSGTFGWAPLLDVDVSSLRNVDVDAFFESDSPNRGTSAMDGVTVLGVDGNLPSSPGESLLSSSIDSRVRYARPSCSSSESEARAGIRDCASEGTRWVGEAPSARMDASLRPMLVRSRSRGDGEAVPARRNATRSFCGVMGVTARARRGSEWMSSAVSISQSSGEGLSGVMRMVVSCCASDARLTST